MDPLLGILTFAFIGSVAGLVGDLIFIVKKSWSKKLSSLAIPLAAGVLLAVSFLDLLPESVESLGNSAFSLILIVFVALFVIEQFFFHLHHHHDDGKYDHQHHNAVPFVLFGDTIHNFLDGVAIAAAFLIDPRLGLVVAIATFLHEVPHELVDFGILVSAGFSPKKALLANFFSSISTFAGALFAYFASERAESINGILLTIAAALFLYVATTDFLPEVSRGNKNSWKFVFSFLFGIALIYLLSIFIPEMG